VVAVDVPMAIDSCYLIRQQAPQGSPFGPRLVRIYQSSLHGYERSSSQGQLRCPQFIELYGTSKNCEVAPEQARLA